MIAWIIICTIITTYGIHNILLYYNILCAIITKLREKCARPKSDIILTNQPNSSQPSLKIQTTVPNPK